MIIEGLGVPSVVTSDCGEFCKYLSIDKLTTWSSNSQRNFGSWTRSTNSESDEVLNKEFSKYSSKDWSSR